MAIDFYKYHALGNDYIVIDPNTSNFHLNQKAIQLICDRNFGIGSDGILYGPILKAEKIELKIFNPDGKVHMPGEKIDIEIKDDRIFMTGSVSAVAKGKFVEDFLRCF
ncbi:hypothetical protein [Scytonema millei]|uniref:hypothetical protein n=1 Tax=Scytonema millei TaxID=1245922 RepID=UPI000584F780|nr:hypothetical protein [Scytonema millei]